MGRKTDKTGFNQASACVALSTAGTVGRISTAGGRLNGRFSRNVLILVELTARVKIVRKPVGGNTRR